MKYFTQDLYDEMQVRGCTGSYFESEEDLQKEISGYASEGRDLYRESRDRFEWMRPHMLRFFPPHLLKYVYDESIMDCNIYSPVMKAEIQVWKNEWDMKWKTVCDQYWAHYDSICGQLPEEVRRLDKEIRLHDATILEAFVYEQKVEILLDLVGYPEHHYKFIFSGVQAFNNYPEMIGDVVQYTEINMTEEGLFRLQILMNSRNIFHITAKELAILTISREN